MKQSFLAIRAIATEFMHRLYLPVTVTVGLISLAGIGVMIWLLTLSAWWLLLAIPVFVLIFIAIVLLVLARLIISIVAPTMDAEQHQTVTTFVDHVQELAEITQTPKAVLLFRVVRDAVSPRKTAYIESVIAGVSGLKREYQDIVTLFSMR